MNINTLIFGEGMRSRAIRSSLMVLIAFGGSNVLRLVSNLILTRLLFPEAFGLMSLVYVFITGLIMLSDIGMNISIIQDPRGDRPDFLNVAWTLQVARGFLVWISVSALAYPLTVVYNVSALQWLLPIAALTAVVEGFTTTRVALANRNLNISIQVFTDLGSQFIAMLVTFTFALLLGNVWCLVIGSLFGSALKVVSQHILIKGPPNRLKFDRVIAGDLLRFGKYILLGSVAGFFVNQSDRAILARFVSLTDLGIFGIAFMFANVPIELARAVGGRVVLPLFSKFPPSDSHENRVKVLRARRLVLLSTVTLSGVLSLASVALIDNLYDLRYHDAGPMLTLFGTSIIAQIVCSNYDGSYLGAGNSKQHFQLIILQAVLQVPISFLFIIKLGAPGAVFALSATMIITYPFRAWIAHQYNAWDPVADLTALLLGYGCVLAAFWIWSESIIRLIERYTQGL